MRVAICLLNFGGGHMEAARNIERAFKAAHPDAEVRILDGIALAPRFVAPLAAFIWDLVQNKLQFIWGWMYTSRFFSSQFFDWWLYSFPWGGLRRALTAWDPDIVVNTHFVCTPLALRLRQKHRLKMRVNFVLTEFVAHAKYDCWDGTDEYFCAANGVKQGLLGRGVPPERVHLTGIPIKPAFEQHIDKAAARAQLDVPADATVLFFFAGTFGGTSLADVLRGIAGKDVYPVVVCGKNEAARQSTEQLLADLKMPGKVYGFVDFMNVIMSACDFMVGKGGALSCSECLALGVPIILYGSPPGNELGNAKYLEGIGAGQVADSITDVIAAIEDWLAHPEKVAAMRAIGLAHGHPSAGSDVARIATEAWRASLPPSASHKQLPTGA